MPFGTRVFYLYMKNIKDCSLYLVITEEYCCGRNALEIAECAIAGGVDIVQLREKNKATNDILKKAKELGDLCRRSGVLFIVNDDPVLAKNVNADGVHLGQEDLKNFTIAEARAILGKSKIVGISTGTIEESRKASTEDVDYIGFGPIFPTKIKDKCVGTHDIEKVLKTSQKPVFFIGGIDLSNIGELLIKGAKGIAVIRAISEADDVQAAAKKLKNKIMRNE